MYCVTWSPMSVIWWRSSKVSDSFYLYFCFLWLLSLAGKMAVFCCFEFGALHFHWLLAGWDANVPNIPERLNIESLGTSNKWGQSNHISVIEPVENMRWFLMNMMSVRLSSDTLWLMTGRHKLYLGMSTHSSYQIHMELLCNSYV